LKAKQREIVKSKFSGEPEDVTELLSVPGWKSARRRRRMRRWFGTSTLDYRL
jgi:hypothetical protein